MALMPPRRSARLSNGGPNSDGLDSSPLRSHGSNAFPAATLKASSSSSSSKRIAGHSISSSSDRNISSGAAAGVGNSSNTTTTTAQSTGKRRERRLEDIESDDEGDDNDASGDFLSGFARPVITGNARHAASIPVPRQPRTTFREEIGEDGFIFSVTCPNTANNSTFSTSDQQRDAKSAGAQVPGAKGPPPRLASTKHRTTSTEMTSLRPDRGKGNEATSAGPSSILATPAMSTGRRVSSSSVKAVRRVSLLRDGTPAYPHPAIADADLFQHCSSELDARDRLRHLTLWTLDRSLKKTLSNFEGSSAMRSTLENAIRATLQGLSKGELALEWPSLQAPGASKPASATAKAKQTHPRNEANRRAEVQLEASVEAMERETGTWQRAREDLQRYEAETEMLVRSAAADEPLEFLLTRKDDDRADALVLQRVRHALSTAAPWLPSESAGSSGSASARVAQTAREMYQREHVGAVPAARPFKRRRTTSNRADETSNGEQTDAGQTVDAPLRGTEADPRWHDVEWNVDQLRSRTHGLAQLARLSQQYTTAVSARGAQAMGELMGSARVEDANAAAITSRLSDDGTSSSRVTREGQQTLQRILSGIRKIQRDDATPPPSGSNTPAAAAAQHPGDVSDGDILRAFAGLRRQPQGKEL